MILKKRSTGFKNVTEDLAVFNCIASVLKMIIQVRTNMTLALLNCACAKSSKKVVLLGASGSIGKTTLEFIYTEPSIEISGLSVHNSTDFLENYLQKHKNTLGIAISNESPQVIQKAKQLEKAFPQHSFFYGKSQNDETPITQLIEYAQAQNADTVVNGIVGAAGIFATLKSIELGMKLCLANKESLVIAGPIIQKTIRSALLDKNNHFSIIPVDSEHNALFQLMEGNTNKKVKKYILSASGGPFYGWDQERRKGIAIKDVLKHPTWQMGHKITVDSALMTNKGLEIIESHFLFDIPYKKLDALIHRSSLVHALLAFTDGSYILSASRPHMVFPIAHALLYPCCVEKQHEVDIQNRHQENSQVSRKNNINDCDIQTWQPLSFSPVPMNEYPNYSLTLEAAQIGGTGPTVLNASNEILVEAFLNSKISFSNIPEILEVMMQKIHIEHGTELELFLSADQKARKLTLEYIEAMNIQ